MHSLEKNLQQRILVLDGAMGTVLQSLKLQDEDFHLKKLPKHICSEKRYFEFLNISRPETVLNIHDLYLAAGADIICTNTINANTIMLEDFHDNHLSYMLNFAGAQLAKKAARLYSTDAKPRYVAGIVGPTHKIATSLKPLNGNTIPYISREKLREAYENQIKGLIDGGVDIIYLETVFAYENAMIALEAYEDLMRKEAVRLPVMLSVCIVNRRDVDYFGRPLKAVYKAFSDKPLAAFGVNCTPFSEQLVHAISALDRISEKPILISPNAVNSHNPQKYCESAQDIFENLKPILDKKILNIIGGCCGTTPEFTKKMAHACILKIPRPLFSKQ